MRRSAAPLAIAFVLGVLAAFAVSCSGTGVKGGLPSTDAANLKSQISDVKEFVDRGDCNGIDGQLRQVQEAIDNLPADTDAKLVSNLRQGAAQLQNAAIATCNARTETQTQTQPQQTVTETIPTVTEPAPTTETTPPAHTTPTTPTETTPTAPTETTPAEPAPTVPGDTSGGAGVTP